MPDRRDPEACDYSNAALAWTGITMFVTRLEARRQIAHLLKTEEARNRLASLCDENLPAVPHGDTIDDYLVTVDPLAVQAVVQAMVRALLEARRLEPFRLFDKHYLLTIDLTGHLHLGERASKFTEGCLTQQHHDGRTFYFRPVCEAKLVTNTGLALSLCTEFVENPDATTPPPDAQDSELPAARRLAPRVKAAFPGFSFCALLDARYCNETGFAMCRDNGWHFIITLKPGSLPSVWDEFQTLRKLAPDNYRQVTVDRITYHLTWINGIRYKDYTLNVLECRFSDPEGHDHCFVWVTDFFITSQNSHALADTGRLRWTTENEGFRTQKHGGFALEHAYALRPNSAKVFYLLLQIAHILSQMFECYCRGKTHVKRAYGSLRNLARLLLESIRRDPIPNPETIALFLAEPIQVRLNTS